MPHVWALDGQDVLRPALRYDGGSPRTAPSAMVDLKPSPLPAPAATGTLAQKPLAHLLVYALERRLTGTLELRAPSGEHAFLVLDEGCIAKVETSDSATNLGRVLFELGHVDEPTLASSLTELASTRRLHGVLLRERGSITE